MFILGLCACHKFGAVFQTVTVIYWHDYASSQKWDCKHAEQTEVHVSFFKKNITYQEIHLWSESINMVYC